MFSNFFLVLGVSPFPSTFGLAIVISSTTANHDVVVEVFGPDKKHPMKSGWIVLVSAVYYCSYFPPTYAWRVRFSVLPRHILQTSVILWEKGLNACR
jgi:hypothetical protein